MQNDMFMVVMVSVASACFGLYAGLLFNSPPEVPPYHVKEGSTSRGVISLDSNGNKFVTYNYRGMNYMLPLILAENDK